MLVALTDVVPARRYSYVAADFRGWQSVWPRRARFGDCAIVLETAASALLGRYLGAPGSLSIGDSDAVCDYDPIVPWSGSCGGRGVTAVAGVDDVGGTGLAGPVEPQSASGGTMRFASAFAD